MKLAVGCPVFERAWCLPLWFDSLEAQNLAPKDDIALCFAYSKGFDGTYDILRRRGEEYGDLMIYEYDLQTYSTRDNMSRFHELTALRNGLLDMAKETGAEYFLSWDNDILFGPDELSKLWKTAKPNNAVGALMDMAGRNQIMDFPSIMHFPGHPSEHAFRRPWKDYDHSGPIKADVIMAVKLMGKEVFENTRYRWDKVGEDIGWCYSCEELGYERYLEPSAKGVHLYDRELAIGKMRTWKHLNYPEILEPLETWYK